MWLSCRYATSGNQEFSDFRRSLQIQLDEHAGVLSDGIVRVQYHENANSIGTRVDGRS